MTPIRFFFEIFLRNKATKMEGMKILLVDDEEEFVKTLSERIEIRGLKADVALSGEQALKAMDENLPDVIVLDLKMPGMDGMEILRRAKKAHPAIQVIMLTGHGSEKDENEARRLGVFEYLHKPVDLESLLRTVTNAYKSKFESSMVAVSVAEASEFEIDKKKYG
jgi:DNA-binding response OmpR family regulator